MYGGSLLNLHNGIGGVEVDRSSQVWEVAGSSPGLVMPKTFKMIVMAVLLVAQGCGVSITTDRLCQDRWTSSTGNLPRKRHDITETLL